MENCKKYGKTYFMPPEDCYDWVKNDSVTSAPIWCSVDLRDDNIALSDPMSLEEKVKFFQLLVEAGFKEIEVGFPAASEREYRFLRTVIEQGMIPEDVTIQVLTQLEEPIIKKTFEAVKGAPHVVIQVRNSMSDSHREQVLKESKERIRQTAVDGAVLLKEFVRTTEGDFIFEYSPDRFPGTQIEDVLEVCNAVLEVWQPSKENKAIISLSTTDEAAMPHVFASQVEYFHKHLLYRENIILSLHPDNVRGYGVSDAELGILAGADRIEGTFFGNGEREENVDIGTLAMNLVSRGVNPELNFSDAVRRNSQFRKGSVNYILKQNFGISLPDKMKEEVEYLIKDVADKAHKELTAEFVFQIFTDHYINEKSVFTVDDCHFDIQNGTLATAKIHHAGQDRRISGVGNGRLDAVSNAIKSYFDVSYELTYYEEHSLAKGSSSKAAAYVGVISDKREYWGAGIDPDIVKASVEALVAAVNKMDKIKSYAGIVDERMLEIMNFICANYKSVTLDDLSEKFYLSKPYLSKYIREKSGTTFGEILKSTRMKKARALLKGSSSTVESIAESVGYPNVEHFNRTFKKLYNITPVQYRNK